MRRTIECSEGMDIWNTTSLHGKFTSHPRTASVDTIERFEYRQRHARDAMPCHTDRTKPYFALQTNHAKELPLARGEALGLPLPFSYNHLLFRATLALPLFVGVPILPADSNSLKLNGELRPVEL